jgi:hypothetical protein
MTWTKTGDEFADECWTLSDAAYRLHHEGLTGLDATGAKLVPCKSRRAIHRQRIDGSARRWEPR